MKIKTVIDYLENKFPLELASDFDNNRIGLIIGDEDIDVNNILLTLDLTLPIIEEAIQTQANLIIAHHPFIYEPLYNLLFQSEKGKIIKKMFEHQISLYVMHTNYDVGENGVNDSLASLLKINNIEKEIKKDSFLRYGEIKPLTLRNLSEFVKEKLELTGVRIAGDLNRLITSVGIVGGGGGHEEDVIYAINKGIDCYITGEVKLNVAQLAMSNNLAIIEVNHGIDKLAFRVLKKQLIDDLKINNIIISNINTDPFIII